ncbi:MAG TPA: hypothetical protein VHV08_03995, partial [Pirellulales bacterium]|nr:hypothetical protein [Pirellulales bacterium]
MDWLLHAALAVALGLLIGSLAQAQEAKAGAETAPANKSGPNVAGQPMGEAPLPGEVMPPVYMLKDKDGKLQPVPGFGFEEFIELYKLKNQLDQQNQQPRFTIQDLTIRGSTTSQRAELTAEYTVLVHVAGWVRVPLRLATAVLREQPLYAGPGEHFLHNDSAGDGYVSWIRAEPGTLHHVTLKLLSTLARIGPEFHLRMNVPRAAVSELELRVPLERPVVNVSEGSTLSAVTAANDGQSILKIVGLASDADIGWHAAENQVASLPAVLEASAAQLIKIDGRTISAEAKLNVRSSGGSFDRFQVRLPPGADYVETTQAGASLAAIDSSGGKGKLYEVKLSKKTTGPVEIRLVTQRACDPQRSAEPIEMAGFEVLGAVRQWGTIGVQVQGNWQILWNKDEHVRDEAAGPAGHDDLAATFEYSAQPYSLAARIMPQKAHVRVESEYVLLVGSDEVQLRGQLKYKIRGAKVRSLTIDLPGWDVDLVGPAGVVSVDDTAPSQGDALTVPLVQPSSGEVELTLEARQKLAPGQSRVELAVPRPRGETITSASVAVVPADNVELSVEGSETSGFAPQASHPALKQLPDRQQDPLFFRTTEEEGKLVLSLKVREQAISSTLATQLEVDDRETRVDQRMAFQIAYRPADHLTLEVPAAIRADRLTITLDGQKLSRTEARERPGGVATDAVTVRVPLPAPRIGRCELAISYVAPHEKLSTATNTLVKVPLITPSECQLSANELTVVPKPGISIGYPKGFPKAAWIEDSRSARPGVAGGLALTARRAIPEVALTLSLKERVAEGVLSIEQEWIQTRLNDGYRQDRAVYRLTSSEPRLRISLPAGVELASLEMDLDGHRIKPELDLQRQPQELVLPLASTTRNEHLVELRYHFVERTSFGALALEEPHFKPAPWVRQMYWQLVLPEQEHVIYSEPNFTREFRWVWSYAFWRRQPTLAERELESWIGATPSADSLRLSGESAEDFAGRQQARAASTNRYLFSMVGTPSPLKVHSLSRARLVLLASLPLLVGGLLLIYFPVARHPAVLFVLAVAVL